MQSSRWGFQLTWNGIRPPAKPWPDYVRLCGLDVILGCGLALAVPFYGDPDHSVETGERWGQLPSDHFPHILPGGLAVVSLKGESCPAAAAG